MSGRWKYVSPFSGNMRHYYCDISAVNFLLGLILFSQIQINLIINNNNNAFVALRDKKKHIEHIHVNLIIIGNDEM